MNPSMRQALSSAPVVPLAEVRLLRTSRMPHFATTPDVLVVSFRESSGEIMSHLFSPPLDWHFSDPSSDAENEAFAQDRELCPAVQQKRAGPD
jgi:hypothetical protein